MLLYVASPQGRARIPEVFPRHGAYIREFESRRPAELLSIGPLAEPAADEPGAMGVFATREAAETFVAGDPFVTEGVVASWTIRTWLISPDER